MTDELIGKLPYKEMWCGCKEEFWKSEKAFLNHIKKEHGELYKQFERYDT